MASGPTLSTGFFIIMERLYETLKEKMNDWKQVEANCRGILGLRTNKAELGRLLLERMIVAHDVAAAFWYFHENK